jgi:hypothetical protein
VIENLLDPASIAHALALALERPKTAKSALAVRQSARRLDFSRQLSTLIESCYE